MKVLLFCVSFSENHKIVQHEVDESGKDHRHKIAEDHIPTGKPFNEQKYA